MEWLEIRPEVSNIRIFVTCHYNPELPFLALEPIPNRFVSELRKYPNLHDTEYAAKKFSNANARTPLVLPLVSKEPRRIIYSVHEYEPLLDSSNMTFQDWLQIVDDIWVS